MGLNAIPQSICLCPLALRLTVSRVCPYAYILSLSALAISPAILVISTYVRPPHKAVLIGAPAGQVVF